MELKFIWIKDYGLIKNLGLNFNHSANDTFNYTGSRLDVHMLERASLNFGKNIAGVTAIAGQNGSGKSSLSHAVLLSTATYETGMFSYEMEFDGIVCYDNHIFYHKSLPISNKKQLKNMGYIISSYKDSPLENLEFGIKEKFGSGGFIYYTNIFDFNSGIRGVNLKNISSSYQLYHAHKYSAAYFNLYKPNGYDFVPKDQLTEPDIYRNEQGHLWVKYYLKEYAHVPFNGPKLIMIISAYSYSNRFLKMDDMENDDYHFYNKIQDEILEGVYPSVYVSQNEHEKKFPLSGSLIRELISQLYRLNLLRFQRASKKIVIPELDARNFVFQNFLLEHDGIDIDKLSELSKIHNLLIESCTVMDDTIFSPYSVKSYYEKQMEDWRFIYLERIYIQNNESNRSLLLKFIETERQFLNGVTESDYYKLTYFIFPRFFSSGEQAFLSLFSRLDDVIVEYADVYHHKESLTIFIDEGDAGFHPKWNKMYLKWILDFLDRRIENVKYQLIFSTHSPYLLSDLTSENILLLRRGQDNSTEIVPTEGFETFGANIHELLSNNFFLDDGTIGEFAKQQINRAIDKLNEWRRKKQNVGNLDVAVKHKTEIFRLITSVGEYIVRGKLLEIYAEIFENDNVAENEIAFLERRIKKLRGS